MFDVDQLLSQVCGSATRVLFYPSCGSTCIPDLMKIDCDVFVFADFSPRNRASRSDIWRHVVKEARDLGQTLRLFKATVGSRVFQIGGKWGFIFFADNNAVLSLMLKAGCRINCFVGLRDGCAEGGNYECVHEPPFLHKVLSLAGNPLRYLTDHSILLVDTPETLRYGHTFFRRGLTVEVCNVGTFNFGLNSVLVRNGPWYWHDMHDRVERDRIAKLHYVVFRPSRAISFRSSSDLAFLSRYRSINEHCCSVLAQYDVWRPTV